MVAKAKPPNSVSAGLATRSLIGGTPSPYAAQVLEIVNQIPRGKVLSYGDIAELVGKGSGRAVGAVMSRHGHEVAWHRVVLSSGFPNPAGPQKALEYRGRYGIDGIMIGRAAIGYPWIFREIKHYLQSGELLPAPTVDHVAQHAAGPIRNNDARQCRAGAPISLVDVLDHLLAPLMLEIDVYIRRFVAFL